MAKCLIWMAAVAACLAGCASGPDSAKDREMAKKPLTYKVPKLTQPLKIDGVWDKAPWSGVEPLNITKHMGEKPEHRPKVQAKLAYDDAAVYVIFHVDDRYVRAVAQKYHDSVCRDSCVEFFFTPGTEVGLSYFNIEINCGGTMLFSWHPEGEKAVPIAEGDCDKLQIGHTMPKIVEPEIAAPTAWTLEYRLPFDVVKKYCPKATKPAPGATWRANLYKCADQTSHPHWLTWSFVDYPKPKFHMPEFFGTLVFE